MVELICLKRIICCLPHYFFLFSIYVENIPAADKIKPQFPALFPPIAEIIERHPHSLFLRAEIYDTEQIDRRISIDRTVILYEKFNCAIDLPILYHAVR